MKFVHMKFGSNRKMTIMNIEQYPWKIETKKNPEYAVFPLSSFLCLNFPLLIAMHPQVNDFSILLFSGSQESFITRCTWKVLVAGSCLHKLSEPRLFARFVCVARDATRMQDGLRCNAASYNAYPANRRSATSAGGCDSI